jgi:[ribosomal protein S5]-alanine N-acetyltransferase
MPGRERLTFRRLNPDDLGPIHLLHSDPATNAHNPYGASPNEAASAAMLAAWVSHWEEHGFGYELAFVGDELAGIAGAREDEWLGVPVANLYWRLLPAFQGKGLSGALAQRAVQIAKFADTGRVVVARMLPGNHASARVAENLGLMRRRDLDGSKDGAAWIIYAHGPKPHA